MQLEDRLEIVEKHFQQEQHQLPEEEIKILDGVDELLAECQELLENTTNNSCDDLGHSLVENSSDSFAA